MSSDCDGTGCGDCNNECQPKPRRIRKRKEKAEESLPESINVGGERLAWWRPTEEQKERLRYWDYVIYWFDYHIRKKFEGEVDDPEQYRRNR